MRLRSLPLAALRAYKIVLSPLLPAACRFAPTCSEYAVEAIEKHGTLRGGTLAVRRLVRCGPWNPGGVDPVPPRSTPGDSLDGIRPRKAL